MKTVAQLRNEIDAADDAIVGALVRRFALTDEMRALKAREGLPRVDATRERAIIARALERTPAAEHDTVAAIYERILGASRGQVETIARGVCRRGGKLLLCRAKGGATSYLPGGHIEFGETAREALVRELREETGLATAAGEFLGVVENSFLQHGKRHCEINLVYALSLPDAADVAAQEDWIEFLWSADPVADCLLPEAMRKF